MLLLGIMIIENGFFPQQIMNNLVSNKKGIFIISVVRLHVAEMYKNAKCLKATY